DYTKERPSSKADYLFRPTRVEFEQTLQNWVEHYRTVPEVHQNYRLLIHRTNLTPRLRFLTTVIALEALYDSKYESETLIPEDEFDEIQSDILEVVPDGSDLQNQLYGLLENVANYPSIKDKLVRLMESEEDLIGTFFDISDLAGEARGERNAAAHGSSESSPMEYNLLSKKLQLTLEALLAREIGVPAESLPSALASRHQELMRLGDFPVSQ
ncbi:HEPN domain-containing protein, partial [Halobacterium salinarum]|uniref:HEPN domain-containing protein n=1 Tax=Halobacterium salinarum TaxID=2242 RepID=UPI002556EEF8